LAIGVDLIGGFPGEDDQAFENTYNLVFRLPLAYLHVFPFSRRQGTPAAKFPDPVPAGVIKARCQSLRDLGIQKRNDFYRSFLGRRVRVLIEGKRDRVTGLLRGFSRNYIPVLIDGGEEWIHQEVEVPITEVQDGKVFGKII
jgi:threonylcarbamoyladenosine tRNA methylthiotransferase MtaB